MFNDLRLALRQLRLTPGFTAVVAFVLALGIGVNVATFGAIDALFFRAPAGVRAPEALRRLNVTMPPVPGQQIFFNINHSLADVAALRAHRDTYAQVGAYAEGTAVLAAGDAAADPSSEPPKSQVTLADRAYFDALGVRPMLGRLFTASEDSAFDAAPVMVATRAYWEHALGGDRAALGHTVRVNGRPFTLIGVLPDGFRGVELTPADVFLPIGMASAIGYQSTFVRKPAFKWLFAVARLAPGVDDRHAAAVGTTVLRAQDAASPGGDGAFDRAQRKRGVSATPRHQH